MQLKKTHLPCPACKSSDAFSIQDNGWGKCFSCGKRFPPGDAPPEEQDEQPAEKNKAFSPVVEYSSPLPERGFTKETVARYKVQVGGDYETPTGKVVPILSKYPLFSPEGEHVGNKVRFIDKDFRIEGNLSSACLLYTSDAADE